MPYDAAADSNLEVNQPIRNTMTNTDIVILDTAQTVEVSKRASEYTADITSLRPHTPEWQARVESLSKIGDEDIYRTGAAAERMLAKTMRHMKDVDGGSAKVSGSLIDLRNKVEAIDPNRSRTLNGFLAKLPLVGGAARSMQRYMREFEPAKTQIDAVVKGLYNGKEELIRDNAAIEVELKSMYESMHNIKEHIAVAAEVEAELERQVEELRATDGEQAERLANDMLFPARQRHQDLMVHQAVTLQSYVALDTIGKNNVELIKGVDRAARTTVTALNAAVMINSALATQQASIQHINSVNETTNSILLSNSKRIKQQTGEIAQQAMASGIDTSKLKEAFTNVFEAMQTLENAKTVGLESMNREIAALESEMARLGEVHNGAAQLEAGEQRQLEPPSEQVA
jgi:uncharacterized protein YaaN involved in tellurite resistance